MVIRPFKPADLPAILQLFYDTVHCVGAKYYNQQQVNIWAPDHPDTKKWLEKLESHITYVAEMDHIIVGFGDMTKTGYVDHIYVHKDYQGRGVALALINTFEEEARKRGIKELTTEASIIAKPLAERRGWQVVKEQRKVVRGMEFINYVMSKKLE